MRTREVGLLDLVTVTGGGTPDRKTPAYWGGTIPWATVKDLTSRDLTATRDSITSAGLAASAANLIPAGAVLLATRIAVGRATINAVDVAINQDLKALRCGPDVDSRYLLHFLDSYSDRLNASAEGATVKGITLDQLGRVRIPLPPLVEQRRIAALLDQADAVRRKREESRRLVDELLRSVFLEMFGDPVRNERGWEVVRLDAIAEIVSGVTIGRHLDPTGDHREVPYLRVANVQDGFLDLSEIKATIATRSEVERYALQAGDILLTEGGDPDKLGRGAVWDGGIGPCIHQNHVFRVRVLEQEFTAQFLNALLGSPYGKRYFLKAAKQTTGIASINRTQLGRFPVLAAPPELQKRFTLAKRSIDHLTTRLENGGDKITGLQSGMGRLLLGR